jgi:hypothetical protein
LGLAVLYLRRGDTSRAVEFYLEVQELEPKNRIVKKALKIIRKYGGTENIEALVEAGRFSALYPPNPKLPFSKRMFVLPLLVFVLAAAMFLLLKLNILDFGKRAGSDRQGLALTMLEKEERSAPVQIDGAYRYVLTQSEVLKLYDEAQKLFSQFHDEEAKVRLNKIIESNASDAIKNKARMLFDYTEKPGFDTLKDRFTYKDVEAEPFLYRDCYVIWSGMAANLQPGENRTSFNLLVGYDTRKTLEGIVAVTLDFAEQVNTEQPLEVLGKVVPTSASGGMEFQLQGIAIHQSGLISDSEK